MSTYVKQIKEAAQKGELVLLMGSSLQQKDHVEFMNKFLVELENSWDVLEHYLPEVQNRNLTTESFYRVLYQYFKDDIFSLFDTFKHKTTDSFHEKIAQIIKSKQVLALGTASIDNKLSLALGSDFPDIPFEQGNEEGPYVSFLNGSIDNKDSLRETLVLEENDLLSASPNLERFYHFIVKNPKAKNIVILGMSSQEYCWQKIYGFMVQLAKKHKQKRIFWVYDKISVGLEHLKLLGNVVLVPYDDNFLDEIFTIEKVEEVSSSPNYECMDKWLENKYGNTEVLEFAGGLLNHVISRFHSLKVLDYAFGKYQHDAQIGGVARVQRTRGTIFFEQGHLEKSIHCHNEAINHWSRSENQEELAKEHLLLGDTYWNAGATDRAVQNYSQSLSIYNTFENIIGISIVTEKLARICDADEDYELAQRYYSECLEIKKKKRSYSEMIQILINLSASLIKNQEWEQATKHLTEALNIGEEYYCASFIEELHQHLGLISMSVLDYDNAYKHYKKSYDVYTLEHDILSSVFVNCNLGHICTKLEKYDDSVKYYEGALESYEKMGDWQHLAAIYNNLGYINNCRKESGLAEEYFSRSVEIFVALGDVMNLIRTHGNLARVYTMQGEFENATECYLANIEMLSQLDEKTDLASTYLAMAIAQSQSSHIDDAKKSIGEAIKIYRLLGMEQEIAEAEEIFENIET